MGENRDGVGLQHEKDAVTGPGKVSIDILAPEGPGKGTSTKTVGGARTVQAPGGSQALSRSDLVEVAIVENSEVVRSGRVRRPSLLAAIVAKAAAKARLWSETIGIATGKMPRLCSPFSMILTCRRPNAKARLAATRLPLGLTECGARALAPARVNERRARAEALKVLLGS